MEFQEMNKMVSVRIGAVMIIFHHIILSKLRTVATYILDAYW